MTRPIVLATAILGFSITQYASADAAGKQSIPPSPPMPSFDLAESWPQPMKAGVAAQNSGYAKKHRTRGVAPEFLPQLVRYDGSEAPGTIIIDTEERFLYLVLEGGQAHRYGVGVGRPGSEWAGVHTVTRKAEWPDWTPPLEMIDRETGHGRILPASMVGGSDSPLGARALYLGDTPYRIHGSNEPWTIGDTVSSGCIRMRNEDVIDLYDRVEVGIKVLVR